MDATYLFFCLTCSLFWFNVFWDSLVFTQNSVSVFFFSSSNFSPENFGVIERWILVVVSQSPKYPCEVGGDEEVGQVHCTPSRSCSTAGSQSE